MYVNVDIDILRVTDVFLGGQYPLRFADYSLGSLRACHLSNRMAAGIPTMPSAIISDDAKPVSLSNSNIPVLLPSRFFAPERFEASLWRVFMGAVFHCSILSLSDPCRLARACRANKVIR